MRIGPTFGDELAAAGVGCLPVVWDCVAGTIDTSDPNLTAAQIASIEKVLAAHDPTKQLPQTDLVTALANQIKTDPNGLAAIKQVLGIA